ncbi:hypothetical protein [Pontibacter ramchanderi]|uniref:Uncharacterized protein n=1 Tax=Pontibacter ramchanderi TaxID=1179743 RepID=A0A2N3U6M3_9BACT|nr:hypothetical protein [Pontibacter ramchanderi]PKV62392.1 hypothetical protein BD749_3893 [Pontibacter ramchanderi]
MLRKEESKSLANTAQAACSANASPVACTKPLAVKETMKNSLQLMFLLLLISCGSSEENVNKSTVEKATEPISKTKQKVRFECISFSIFPGMGTERYSKDVEINNDSTVYYRLRERHGETVVENYIAKLDSQSMGKVYGLMDSIDFNSLKEGFYFEDDGAFHSLQFVFDNGEARMVGTMQGELEETLYGLLDIVEKQNLIKGENRNFTTTADVLVPPPPAAISIPYDSLKRK